MRVMTPDSQQTQAIISLCYAYEWNRIGVIAMNESYGISGIDVLTRFVFHLFFVMDNQPTHTRYGHEKNIAVEHAIYESGSSPVPQLEYLKQQGITVFVVFVVSNPGVLIRSAISLGMLQQPYVWILPDTFTNLIEVGELNGQVTVTEPDLQDKIAGVILVRPNSGEWGKRKFFFENWPKNDTSKNYDLFAFDATLLYGYTIARMVKEGINMTSLLDETKRTQFNGVTGPVKLNELGDRTTTVFEIINILGNNSIISATWSIGYGLHVDTPNLLLPGNVTYFQTIGRNSLLLQNTSRSENVWSPVSLPPPVLHSHSFNTFPLIDQLILFGGFGKFSEPFNELWIFDIRLRMWFESKSQYFLLISSKLIHKIFQVSPMSKTPEGRLGHAAFVWTNRYYIFGGFNGRYFLNDLHYYSPQSLHFREISPLDQYNIPTTRAWMCSVINGDEAYLFGGESVTDLHNDVWRFRPKDNSWDLLQPTSTVLIPKRSHACMVYKDNMLFVWGGVGDQLYNDMWAFNLTSLVWNRIDQVNAPTARIGMTCALYNDDIYLGLGSDQNYNRFYNDLYRCSMYTVHFPINYPITHLPGCFLFGPVALNSYSNITWVTMHSNIPDVEPRTMTQFTLYDHYLFFFGGLGKSTAFNSFFSYDLFNSNMKMIHPNSAPSIVCCICWDLFDNHLLFKKNQASCHVQQRCDCKPGIHVWGRKWKQFCQWAHLCVRCDWWGYRGNCS